MTGCVVFHKAEGELAQATAAKHVAKRAKGPMSDPSVRVTFFFFGWAPPQTQNGGPTWEDIHRRCQPYRETSFSGDAYVLCAIPTFHLSLITLLLAYDHRHLKSGDCMIGPRSVFQIDMSGETIWHAKGHRWEQKNDGLATVVTKSSHA